MPYNNHLISLLAKDVRFGTGVKAIHRRSQALSIIYVNIFHYAIVFFYEAIAMLTADSPGYFILSFMLIFPTCLSFWFLRRGSFDSAVAVSVISMQFLNFFEGHVAKQPLTAIYGLMMYSTMAYCLFPSLKVQIMFLAVSAAQFTHHIILAKEIFKVTTTDAQTVELDKFYAACFSCLFFACALCFFKRVTEVDIWKMAQSSYEKSENLTKEVLEASAAKDIFVSSLSHEIRNPLNAINGSIDYLLETVKDTSQLQVLKNAKLSAEVLLNLVSNVLDAAKLRSDKMEVIPTESSFVDIVRKTFIINSEKLRAGKVRAEAFIQDNVPSRLWIDPSRLLQVMMNLVSNSLKFTPSGGKIRVDVSWCSTELKKEKLLAEEGTDLLALYNPSRNTTNDLQVNTASLLNVTRTESSRIDSSIFDEFDSQETRSRRRNTNTVRMFDTVFLQDKNPVNLTSEDHENWTIHHVPSSGKQNHLTSEHGYLKVQVSDTGCGIPQDRLPRLFNMFEQAHQSVNNMHGGTGLGLWICKQLCQKMQGDITIYSQQGKGTSFVFYIMVNNKKVSEYLSLHRGEGRSNINVLVVDDYSVNRDLHKLLLQKEGANVITGCNGQEAVDKYKSQEEGFFDFIMMDVLMPEVDGFAAAKTIRQFEREHRRKQVDIYFVSGEYFDEEDLMTSFRRTSGGEMMVGIRCLRKPIDVEKINKIVQSYKAP